MKRLLLFMGVLWLMLLPALQTAAQTAEVLVRPAYIDLSTETSQSAVLIKLSVYPSDDVRYRLYNGSNQYWCWNSETGSFVATNAYSSGPQVFGTPSSSAVFWIPFRRGGNNSATATYRDRLGPLYSVNYRDVALPAATAMEAAFSISGTLLPGTGLPLSDKYIVLAFSQEQLMSASHSDIGTGDFAVACPAGKATDKIEIRTIGNEMAAVINGGWAESATLGTIQLSIVNGVIFHHDYSASGQDYSLRVYPVPAKKEVTIEAGFVFTEVEVLSLTGRQVLHSNFPATQRTTIDVERLPAGVYFVLVCSNNRFYSCTVIKS